MDLSDKEIKFLKGFKSYAKRIYINYFCGGLAFLCCLSTLIIGIKFNDKGALVGAMFFGYIGLSIVVVSRIYKRFYNIIVKLETSISE